MQLITFCLIQSSSAQYKDQLSPKVSIAINRNLETYFFAEKLAVEKMGGFVFDNKGEAYAHQPMVYFSSLQFKKYQDTPAILRIAVLLTLIRDKYQDNSKILYHLINQKDFPEKGSLFSDIKSEPTDKESLQMQSVIAELTDSLRSFYVQAHVGTFFKDNARYYTGALKEVEKDINVPAFSAMEKWFGRTFPAYQLYISPAMPITFGEDNYRGVGQQVLSAKGIVPGMIISSSRMILMESGLLDYQKYGFDNPRVTEFLTKHEIGHSFVNPLLEKYAVQIKNDSSLFTPGLKKILAPHYIGDWYVCVIEHIVRMSEIRTAISMGDFKEADRLRLLHIFGEKCVLIPLLEMKIASYEADRSHYPTFESYLPDLVTYLHSLTPEIINQQVVKYEHEGK